MDGDKMLAIFITCHLLGMASTVFNPIMYGYKNEHMRRDLITIVNKVLKRCGVRFYTDGGDPDGGAGGAGGPGGALKTGEHAIVGEEENATATAAGIGLGPMSDGEAQVMLGPALGEERKDIH